MKRIVITGFFFSCLLTSPVLSQNLTLPAETKAGKTNNRSVLFSSDDLMEITLQFDITTFKRVRSDTTELDAVLTYHISETDSVTRDIKLRARGILRKRICEMPPIRLNFVKSDTSSDIFRGIDKVKVVTYCRPGNGESVLSEYLVYRLYNLFTDYSFKVRLARITYINTNKKQKPLTEFAFFIEPMENLCERTGLVEITSMNLTQKNVRPEMMDRMAIFNYMIGNTDWSVPIHHNVVLMADPASAQSDLALIIPYDFDQAGLVGTKYAAPIENLPIKSVLERLYLGVCRSEEEFAKALVEFSDKKDDLCSEINEFPYLKESSRKRMIKYLNEFFSGINNKNTIVYKLRSECIDF